MLKRFKSGSLLGAVEEITEKSSANLPLAQHWQSFAMSCSHWPKPMDTPSCLWVMVPVPLSR